jgi:hypothetical protein
MAISRMAGAIVAWGKRDRSVRRPPGFTPGGAVGVVAAALCLLATASCNRGTTYPFGPYVDHAAVRGTVTDASGNPVGGAVVTVTVTDKVRDGPDVTAGRGETGPTGIYRVTIERMGPNSVVPNPPETHQALVSVTRSGGGLTSATVVLRFGPITQAAPESVADIVFRP